MACPSLNRRPEPCCSGHMLAASVLGLDGGGEGDDGVMRSLHEVFVLCCITTATATWEKYALQFEVGWSCRWSWWREEHWKGCFCHVKRVRLLTATAIDRMIDS